MSDSKVAPITLSSHDHALAIMSKIAVKAVSFAIRSSPIDFAVGFISTSKTKTRNYQHTPGTKTLILIFKMIQIDRSLLNFGPQGCVDNRRQGTDHHLTCP